MHYVYINHIAPREDLKQKVTPRGITEIKEHFYVNKNINYNVYIN